MLHLACIVTVRSKSWHDVVTFTATGRVHCTRGKAGSRSGIYDAVPKITVNAVERNKSCTWGFL